MKKSLLFLRNLVFSHKIVFSVLFVLFIGVVLLELLGYFCKTEERFQALRFENPCPLLTPEQQALNKKQNYTQRMSTPLAEILNTRVIYIPRKEIGGNNGVTCSGFAYVAEDLPQRAKWYVAIHEAIHLTGEFDETKTNYKAALKEPYGFVETILHSLYYGYSTRPVSAYPCVTAAQWAIFKLYFLGIDFRQ